MMFGFSTTREAIMDRNQVTQKIIAAKVARKMRWADLATQFGQSKEWTTAALLGQMTFNRASRQGAATVRPHR
jgi:cyanate lyase